MKIKVMQLGMIGTNCYIFWEEGDRRCGIVDPGDSGEQVAAWIQDQGLEPQAILLTHSHFDHILGIPGLRAQWPQLPVYCHPADVDEMREATTSVWDKYRATIDEEVFNLFETGLEELRAAS